MSYRKVMIFSCEGGDHAGKGHYQNEYKGAEEAQVGSGGDREVYNTEDGSGVVGIIRETSKATYQSSVRGMRERACTPQEGKTIK